MDDNLLYAVNSTANAAARYNSMTNQWSQIPGTAAQYLGNGDALYAITLDKSAVQRFNVAGNAWTRIGRSMERLVSGRRSLHGIDQDGQRTYIADEQGEGRPPDFTVPVYGLDELAVMR